MTTRLHNTTIQETARAMAELLNGTDPSLLHALRAAGISPKMRLRTNCAYATHLCQYRDMPLPTRDVLISGFVQAGLSGIMQSHVDTLYAIDEFWFNGGSDTAHDFGYTLDSQRAWRCRMNSLIRGMAFKTLSWALAIYMPEHCQLLALDIWHARRLEVDQTSFTRDNELSHTYYEMLETRMLAEMAEKYPGYPPIVGAACEWYNIRNSGPESHSGLNCRITDTACEAAD